ncbi:hypothetical protein EK21DRAFT_107642 [Setomelanomma holmii]|uniref:Uncharacterized protein n=1 Tax=Setomelanomma holmii TaxID=210430 RepID=A0A9P4LS24_9PLEO|nr:hypothetical protein EK21DRAFT_107642 [Setomelanomma holmii]
MLTSPFTSSDTRSNTALTQELVLPIPSARMFTDYASLQWFQTVPSALGIYLHFLEGHELAYNIQGQIGLMWHQSYQKDFDEGGKEKGKEAGARVDVDVWKKAVELIPGIEEKMRYDKTAYYRVGCGGELKWFDVWHKGR